MTLSSLAVLPSSIASMTGRSPMKSINCSLIARVLADPTLFAVPASAPWKYDSGIRR